MLISLMILTSTLVSPASIRCFVFKSNSIRMLRQRQKGKRGSLSFVCEENPKVNTENQHRCALSNNIKSLHVPLPLTSSFLELSFKPQTCTSRASGEPFPLARIGTVPERVPGAPKPRTRLSEKQGLNDFPSITQRAASPLNQKKHRPNARCGV